MSSLVFNHMNMLNLNKIDGNLDVYKINDDLYVSAIGIFDKDENKFYKDFENMDRLLRRYDLRIVNEYESLSGKTIRSKLLVPRGTEHKKIGVLRLDTRNKVVSVRRDEYMMITYSEDRLLGVCDFSNLWWDKLIRIRYTTNVYEEELAYDKYVVSNAEGIRFWNMYENNKLKFVMSYEDEFSIGNKTYKIKINTLLVLKKYGLEGLVSIWNMGIYEKVSGYWEKVSPYVLENELVGILSKRFMELGIRNEIIRDWDMIKFVLCQLDVMSKSYKDYESEFISISNI